MTKEQRMLLREYFGKRFNLEELTGLASDLDIAYDQLPHRTRGEFVIDLILYCERQKCLVDLIEYSLKQRLDPDISQLLQQLKYLAISNKPINLSEPDEEFFDAGDRVRQIREDLQLNKGRFARLIGFRSDKEYDALEQGNIECTLATIQKINEVTGADLDWLKYGADQCQYERATSISTESWKGILQKLDTLGCQSDAFPNICVVIGRERFDDVGIVAITNSYMISEYKALNRYKALQISLCTDFWVPMNDAPIRDIFNFYRLLREISSRKSFYVRGQVITQQDRSDLYLGKRHPSKIIKDQFANRPQMMKWPEDILDINYAYRTQKDYNAIYGDWFVEMQRYFRHAVKTEAEKAEDKN